MTLRIVSLTERPDLVPVVAFWQWKEWGEPRGRLLGSVTTDVTELVGSSIEAGFVMLDGEHAVGTACLTAADLDTRPDLSPWLASVFVEPSQRGRGIASALVRTVEQTALRIGYPTLWLFTWDTAPLYRRLGWEQVGVERHHGELVTLMRRDLRPDQFSVAAPPLAAAGR